MGDTRYRGHKVRKTHHIVHVLQDNRWPNNSNGSRTVSSLKQGSSAPNTHIEHLAFGVLPYRWIASTAVGISYATSRHAPNRNVTKGSCWALNHLYSVSLVPGSGLSRRSHTSYFQAIHQKRNDHTTPPTAHGQQSLRKILSELMHWTCPGLVDTSQCTDGGIH